MKILVRMNLRSKVSTSFSVAGAVGGISIVREIKRKTRRKYSAEEKIRIGLEGLRGEQSITDLSRREGIHPGIYYKWRNSAII